MEKKWERPDFYFGEDEFEDRMTMLGKTFRKQVDIDGDFEGCRGVRIHYTYLLHPEERAAVVISHGFCEVMPKYDELIYYFYQLGYSVFFIDHRGHGRSGRCIDHPGKIYVDDFMDYIEDLKTYMDKVVTVFSRSKKYLLFAHSMGGAIGTLFLEHYPDYFQAAVLCAPMIEMQYGDLSPAVAKMICFFAMRLHWQERYLPGHGDYQPGYDFENSAAMSRKRYDYICHIREKTPEYQLGGATYGWMSAAVWAAKEIRRGVGNIRVPILMFQAGRDTFVRTDAQDWFAEHSAQTKLVRFPESKHEIYNASDEIRKDFLNQAFAFFAEQISDGGRG